jgi:hypothetical protein
MPLKDSVHSTLLPVPQPHGNLGTVNLEDVGNFRRRLAFHIESNCVKAASNTICPVAEGLLAKFNQLLYLFDCSINLNRSHGTSYFGDDAIISYVALFMQGYIITLQKKLHEKAERGENLTREELDTLVKLTQQDPYRG